MRKKVIHLVDDESIIHDIFRRIFREPEFELIISTNRPQAKKNHHAEVDVVIMDQMIPGTSGMEIFLELKSDDPEVKVIFLTAFGTIEGAIEAIKEGAVDYIQKPFDNIDLKYKIDRVIREKRLLNENLQLKKNLSHRFSFGNIIGRSPLLLKTFSMIESIANSSSTVLITGESGTGKELIAQAIHQNSNRRDKPFYPFNSSNIPASLCESLLFGYKKGSFTGAVADKKGLFEEADEGTLFFDEIANLETDTQAKILRAIQEKEIQPLGSNKTLKVDVRLIAATNVELKKSVEKNQFREDLYYRLNIINIHLPPLRERMEDIPLLAEAFIVKYRKENKKEITGMSEKFLQHLMEYHWPGNIRELENTIERAVIMAEGNVITAEELNISGYGNAGAGREWSPDLIRIPPEGLKLEEVEKSLVLQALERCRWVQKDAAKLLGLTSRVLNYKVKAFNITHPRWRRNR